MDTDAIKTKLGIDPTSGESIKQALLAELEQIEHLAATSTVASDMAVLKSRAAVVLGHLGSMHAAFGDDIRALKAGLSELVAKVEGLAGKVNAPPPPPPPPPPAPPEPPAEIVPPVPVPENAA